MPLKLEASFCITTKSLAHASYQLMCKKIIVDKMYLIATAKITRSILPRFYQL